jgi:Homeodomain-like domain
MFVKPAERERARALRRDEGRSIKEIAALLRVSPSSVSRWTADIALSPGFAEALRQRNPAINGRLNGSRGKSVARRDARMAEQQRGRELARHPTRLHLAGCMLYWAEGSKDRNTVKLTNSDPDLLALFVRFLRECYAVAPHRMALSINCHLNNGLELGEIEAWWLHRLGLPAASLRKATVNAPSRASRWRRNVLIYGTARVSVYSTAIVQSIYGAIQHYAGIDRPEWGD